MQNSATRFKILCVDDSEDILALLDVTLGREYDVRIATDARSALRVAFEKPRPDLIILDVEMPGTNGYDLCRAIKASPALADVPVVFLTQRDNARDVVQGFQLGAIDYFAKPINPPVLAARIRAHVELITRRGLQDELIRERTMQLEQTRLQLIRRLGRAMEYHETSAVGNRVVRLGHYARLLAEASGAKAELCDRIMKAAPLHDIGKLGVPAQILRKAEKLSAPELVQMQRHPEIGAEIIGEHDDPLLKLARTLALTHHERWDGTGYPAGIGGDDIPWPGRVMALVDAFEGMTATQFHREPMTLHLAADEITRGSGKQFDPHMVEAFRKCLPAFRQIKETYADDLGDMLDLDFSAASPRAPAVADAVTGAQRAAAEAIAATRMRESDLARAGVLAEEQKRINVERDLLSAATKDVSTQQAARKRAEAAAAREAEAMGLHRRRVAEQAAAAQAAAERAKAEADAAALAQQAEIEKMQALARSETHLAAEKKLVAAAEARIKAETALAATAAALVARDGEAREMAVRRLEVEKEATRLAMLRARTEAAAAAHEAEAMGLHRRRVAEQAAAAQAATEGAKAEADAAALAQQAEIEKLQALARSESHLAAEKKLTAAAEARIKAETALAATAAALVARDGEAREVAVQRLEVEKEATRLAMLRARSEAEAADVAQKTAQANAQRLAEVQARVEAETLQADAAREKRMAEEAATQTAEALAALERQSMAVEAERGADEAATQAAIEKHRAAAETHAAEIEAALATPASPPSPSPPVSTPAYKPKLVFVAALVAVAGAGIFHLLGVEPRQAPAPPPRAPIIAEAAPVPGLSEGPALLLRLDSNAEKFVGREN